MKKRGYKPASVVALLAIFIVLSSNSTSFSINEVINATHANGLAAWGPLNTAQPYYRTWNGTGFSATLTDTNSLGTNGTGDITWVVVKGNHERDEIIMGTEDLTNDVNIQIYNSSGSWGNLLEVSSDIFNSNSRGFDIAYEDLSGDALIVYENSSVLTNSDLAYRIWNGTDYSEEKEVLTTLAASAIRWVALVPEQGSDNIMALFHNNAADLYAVPWNGTDFDYAKEQVLTTTAGTSIDQHFAFAWEESSGGGLVGYAGGTDFNYRTYSPTAPFWSTAATIAIANGLSATRMCSDPDSDYIGIIFIDAGNDVNVRGWDGTSILASPPTENANAEPSGANNANVDCAWLNSTTAMFGYVGFANLSLNYFFFSKTNTWSVSDLSLAENPGDFASDDIDGLRFAKHPASEEVMVLSQDILEDVTLIRWDGTVFLTVLESPIETSTDVLTAAQESAMFDWYRYDTVPNVTDINVNQTSFSLNDNVLINVTVNDNINVSTVSANISLPQNSSYFLLELSDADLDSVYDATFSTTDLNGVYTLQIVANDTSTHNNINDTESITFGVGDSVFPNVTFIEPPNETAEYPLSTSVNIQVNVSDNIAIDSVLANVTLPNGSISELVFYNITTNELNSLPVMFEQNETNTNVLGTYTIRIIVNDSSNSINSSETRPFFIGDSTKPLVFNLNPAADTNYDNNSQIEVSANVTDNGAVEYVFANITLPNGTEYLLQLMNDSEVSQIYNATFNLTDISGYYNITFNANDTANNVNDTETTNFTVGDFTPPSEVSLDSPSNEFNTTLTNLTFNFTVIDDQAESMNCSLTLNSEVQATNLSTLNNSLTNFDLTSLADAKYEWNITCVDPHDNYNTSDSRILRIDNSHPNFTSLTTSPSSEEDLDPGVNVTAVASVTDDILDVDAVILQYRPNSTNDYTNLTMELNPGTGNYNTTFNATETGMYFLRIVANDTLNNQNTSAEINITVELDTTWTRTPATFDAIVAANLNDIVGLGNLTVNNTGDTSLDFNITSDSSNTAFNETEHFILTASEFKILEINDSATVGGVKAITLTINSTGNPAQQTTTGNIIFASGQPVLSTTFTTPSTETLSIAQGDAGIEFSASLENIGEANASNVTFFFLIPEEWTVTFGDTNLSFDELLDNESQTSTILVNIPSNATTGTTVVTVNATGLNESSTDLADLGFILGDTISVTVSSAGALGPEVSASGAPPTPSAEAAAAAAGGEGAVAKTPGVETVYTSKTFEVKRGEEKGLPLTITNSYENAYMENIQLEVIGFLSQYIKINPPKTETRQVILSNAVKEADFTLREQTHKVVLNEVTKEAAKITISSEPISLTLKEGGRKNLDLDGNAVDDTQLVLESLKEGVISLSFKEIIPTRLSYLESLDYTVDIFAPPYLEKKEYKLNIKITADILAINSLQAGFTTKRIEEYRTLTFIVREVSQEESLDLLAEARRALQEMEEAGIPSTKIKDLLKKAEAASEKNDYEVVKSLADQIAEMKKRAFEAKNLIDDVNDKISLAEEKWLKTPETLSKLSLAVKAFEREDFNTAVERAKDAQLTYILETRGRINILWFLKQYWWAVLLSILALWVIIILTYKRLIVHIIAQRLKNLVKEEATIIKLMKDAQKECFEEKKMPLTTCHKLMHRYETRLIKIRQIRARLRNKKAGIIKTEQELKNLEKEHEEIIQLIKKAQIEYFKKGVLSRKAYLEELELDHERLAEIEKENIILEEKLEKEKLSKKYKILNLIYKSFILSKNVLQRIKEHKKKVKARLTKKQLGRIEKKREETEETEEKLRKTIFDFRTKEERRKDRFKGKWVVIKVKQQAGEETKKEEKS